MSSAVSFSRSLFTIKLQNSLEKVNKVMVMISKQDLKATNNKSYINSPKIYCTRIVSVSFFNHFINFILTWIESFQNQSMNTFSSFLRNIYLVNAIQLLILWQIQCHLHPYNKSYVYSCSNKCFLRETILKCFQLVLLKTSHIT